MAHEVQAAVEEDDQDSLFGSPPPSPRFEGRAPSPALALPSAASTNKGSLSAQTTSKSAAADIQNVGTIALPGSQPDSEFPIHPLALSLNHGMVPRPPALPQKQSQTTAAYTSAVRSDSTVTPSADPSRSSATAPPTSCGTSSSKKKSRPSQSRYQSEPVTEPALEFTLPDPSAPPPAHFLRSQENLLGKAGRVGGITTATLSQPRGSTPSNPILINDDDDTPMIGRRHGSKSRESSQKPIDPMKLARPTNEEIVSVLVGQKDIFPVLESILKLIAKGAQPKPPPPPRPTGFERRPPGSIAHESVSPPAKKRKLNRVPAGATDWDVPFPFADGEGPTTYHQNWERDRGKQLVTELIKLIKVASRKAAAKKYISEQKGEQTGDKDVDMTSLKSYYRPETALYGLSGSHLEGGIEPKDGEPVPPLLGQPIQTITEPSLQPAVSPSLSQEQEELQQTLEQLLSSSMHPPTETTARTASEASQLPTIPLPDKDVFDAWMNILEAFPLNSGTTEAGAHPSSGETTNVTTPLSAQSASGNHGPDQLPIPLDLDDIFKSIMETPSSINTPSVSAGDNLNSQDFFSPPLFDFNSLTPNLPGISSQDLPSSNLFEFNDFAPTPIPSMGDSDAFLAIPSIPSLSTFSAGIRDGLNRRSSPLLSASSESRAVTPASAIWDLSLPDISGDGEGQGMWQDMLWPMFDDVTQPGFSGNSGDVAMEDPGRSGFADKEFGVGLQPPVIDKGKGKEVVESSTTKIGPQFGPIVQSAFNALSTKARDERLACINSSASLSTGPSTSAVAKPMKRGNETEMERLRRKEDIMRRAKERRQEIQEDLNNIKLQLWETTIEQAALIELTKKIEVEGEISSETGHS